MNSFNSDLLQKRFVSIWGLGYLGYTSILEMQSKGFAVKVWDYLPGRIERLIAGGYPEPETKAQWSIGNEMPAPDSSLLTPVADPLELLDAAVQILCVPNDESTRSELESCADILARIPRSSDTLVLLLSAGRPGYIDETFAPRLAGSGCRLAAAFRKDWYFEEMLTAAKPRIIAANDQTSLDMASFFFELTGTPVQTLNSLKAGEILAHSAQVFENLGNSFINQLAFAFPSTDIRDLAKLLFDGFAPRRNRPGIGYTDMHDITALGSLADGAIPSAPMTILEEARRGALSTLLAYADLLIAQKINSVAVLGLPPIHAPQRDVRVSPSRILAEYFHNNGIAVSAHSPEFDEKQLRSILPFARYANLEEPLGTDAVVLMTNQLVYRRFNQGDIDRLGISTARFCIDNTGILKHFRFSARTLHHIPGDGRLNALRG